MFTNWRGIVAPPGITDDREAATDRRCSRRCTTATRGRRRSRTNGWTDAFPTGDEFSSFLDDESKRVEDVLSELGPGMTAAATGRAPGSRAAPSTAVALFLRAGRPRRRRLRRAACRRAGSPAGRSARTPCRSSSAALLVVRRASSSPSTSARGGRGEPEGGEDVDLDRAAPTGGPSACSPAPSSPTRCSSSRSAGRSAARSCSAGAAFALGNRHYVRDARHRRRAVASAPGTLFALGLGINLPGRHPEGNPLMDSLTSLIGGFAQRADARRTCSSPLLGVLLGTAIGVLPGIGPAMTVALLLPLTYGLDADQRAHHVRRHLLRRHVRRVDDLDPAQHPRRERRRSSRPSRATRWRRPAAPRRRSPPPRSARSSPAPSARCCWSLLAPPVAELAVRARRAGLLRDHGARLHRGDVGAGQLPGPRVGLARPSA